MANLNNEIIVKQELRPCLARGRKAIFHKWIEKTEFIGNDKYTAGLVEFEDGTLDEVSYIKIKFVDNKIKEFSFEETKTDDFDIGDDLPF